MGLQQGIELRFANLKARLSCRFNFRDVNNLHQSRNFVIWGPGANIHYGAPFFSTKLLFTVQESLRFFGVFRRLCAMEIDILQHLYMLCVALVLTSSLTCSASAVAELTCSASAVVEPSLLRAAFSDVSD